jgi:hypothetical protein
MHAPSNLTLVVYQGADLDYQLIWKIGDDRVDLADYTARLQARPPPVHARPPKEDINFRVVCTSNGSPEVPLATEEMWLFQD